MLSIFFICFFPSFDRNKECLFREDVPRSETQKHYIFPAFTGQSSFYIFKLMSRGLYISMVYINVHMYVCVYVYVSFYSLHCRPLAGKQQSSHKYSWCHVSTFLSTGQNMNFDKQCRIANLHENYEFMVDPDTSVRLHGNILFEWSGKLFNFKG